METVLRVALIYVLILVSLRVMGKRELSQLAPMELVMLLLIPELVAQALVREDFSMTNAVVAMATLTSLVWITSALVYRFKRFGQLVEGSPALLVQKGEPVSETMDLERVPPDELVAEMREAGIEKLEDVKWAVLETGGRISFVAYRPDDKRPPPEEERAG